MTKELAKLTVSHIPKIKKRKKPFTKRLSPITDDELRISWELLSGKLNSQVRKPI